jgi:hypothetical protein
MQCVKAFFSLMSFKVLSIFFSKSLSSFIMIINYKFVVIYIFFNFCCFIVKYLNDF